MTKLILEPKWENENDEETNGLTEQEEKEAKEREESDEYDRDTAHNS